MTISIEISGNTVLGLGDVPDEFFSGHKTKSRATNVEWDQENQWWFVRSVSSGNVVARGFDNRADAIEWEKDNFSPHGEYWAEAMEVIREIA